ncbi:MAG: ligase-associated DNA damage response endonuclease PdeM [Flavobacteriales bacterium]|nr:ligase-associated DNA damage response endonuclease PdeM [Flavobacteriales bacterium]
MLPFDIEIHRPGVQFTMHPWGGLFWRERNWLLVSDLHLGKAAHFRKAGVPLPEGDDAATLERLAQVLDHFKPDRLIILGDLFHSDLNRSWDGFEAWCRSRNEEVHLVPGNHDRLSERRYRDAGLMVHEEEVLVDGIILRHDPMDRSDERPGHRIGGHLHPGVVLSGAGQQRITLPCFVTSPTSTVLPAFGLRQGLFKIRPTPMQRVFACTPTSVLDVTGVSLPIGSRTR